MTETPTNEHGRVESVCVHCKGVISRSVGMLQWTHGPSYAHPEPVAWFETAAKADADHACEPAWGLEAAAGRQLNGGSG